MMIRLEQVNSSDDVMYTHYSVLFHIDAVFTCGIIPIFHSGSSRAAPPGTRLFGVPCTSGVAAQEEVDDPNRMRFVIAE